MKKQKTNSKFNNTIYSKVNWSKANQFINKSNKERNLPNLNPKTEEILRLAAVAAGIGLFIAFPPIAVIAGGLMKLGQKQYHPWKVKKVIKRLEKQKYVNIKYNRDSITVTITKFGRMKALTYELDKMSLRKPIVWDKKWRLVIFDVPEKNRIFRDMFRKRLKQLNLYPLQKSVYISPYPCFEEIEFLRELYRVSFSVEYLLVEKVENDDRLRRHFKL